MELFPGRIALSVAADVEPAGAERTRDASLASGPAPAALALGVALGSSAAPLAPAVGAIDSSLIASRDRSLNTGPAEVEPVSPDAVSKRITVTETCGRSAGRNPAKVVTWWELPSGQMYASFGSTLVGDGIRPVPVLAATG